MIVNTYCCTKISIFLYHKIFSDIVTTISKLSKECVLRLSDDKLYFIVCEDNSGPAPPVLWCEMSPAVFFSDYQMIGIDDEHKDIYLGIVSGRCCKNIYQWISQKVFYNV